MFLMEVILTVVLIRISLMAKDGEKFSNIY